VPAARGFVARADGIVTSQGLSFDLCGEVNVPGARVMVAIDGGTNDMATVVGTHWCLPVTLVETPPRHVVDVQAAAGDKTGAASLQFDVDYTPPDPITSATAVAASRNQIHLTWIAPGDHGQAVAAYTVKYATTPLDDSNFDVTGTAIAAPTPQAPGSQEVL